MLCGTFAGILINEAASGMKNIIISLTFHHGALFPFLYKKKKKNILKTEKKAEYLTHHSKTEDAGETNNFNNGSATFRPFSHYYCH